MKSAKNRASSFNEALSDGTLECKNMTLETRLCDECFSFIVKDEDAGKRIDTVISSKTEISRSSAQKAIGSRNVLVNGGVIQKNYKVSAGDLIVIKIPETEMCDVEAEDIPLSIVYEDSDIIVINKPQGMVVHPAPGHSHGTLVSALLFHCGDSLSGIGGVMRPGIVHRIDKDTSGLICAAKNDSAHLFLSAQLSDHSMHRKYLSIACGRLPKESGRIEAPIGRSPSDRKKMAVIPGGKQAVTNYKLIEEINGFSYTEMQLETGRTHQIRVHMAYIGHPLLGDHLYGGGSSLFEKHHPNCFSGQCLHASELILTHPATKRTMCFSAPAPENFNRILSLLRNGAN